MIGNLLKIPKLPVAGFWLRLLAHVIDWILILSALHIFSRAIPNVYFALGRWAPYLNSLFAFLYFVLFNGPFGRGRTLGKLIIGIRVTDYAGEGISYRQALIRTVVLYPLFVTVPLMEVILGHSHSEMGDYIQRLVTVFPAAALWLATAIVIAFNPFKQGLHDYLAETLVQPGRTTAVGAAFEDLAAKMGVDWKQFHRQPQISGLITIVMVVVLLGYMSHPSLASEAIRERYRETYAMTSVPELAGSRFESNMGATVEVYRANAATFGYPKLTDDDSLSSQSLVFVLENNRADSWDGFLTKAQQETVCREMANTFAEKLIPKIAQQAAQMESNPAELEKILGLLKNNPVVIIVALNHTIMLTPYPDPLKKKEYSLQVVKKISLGTVSPKDTNK